MTDTLTLQLVASWLISVLSGSTASVVIQWVKTKLGWENGNAWLLSAVGAVLFSFLSLWATGRLLPGTVGWGNFLDVLFLVGATSWGFFRKWYKK